VIDQLLQSIPAHAEVRERFHHVRAGGFDLQRDQFVRGRSRVVRLSLIGHDVVFHGDQDARDAQVGER
jgi:hypothetical protein